MKADGNEVEIDLQASVEIAADPCLGRIAHSFVQLEEKFEREKIAKAEKERRIQELQKNIGEVKV